MKAEERLALILFHLNGDGEFHLTEQDVAALEAIQEQLNLLRTATYRCEEMCEAAQWGGNCRCSELHQELPAMALRAERLERIVAGFRAKLRRS